MISIDDRYVARLKKMTPVQRLMIAIELTELVRKIAIAGIKSSNSGLKRAAVMRKLRERIYG